MGNHKKKSATMNLTFGFFLVIFSVYVIISSLNMKYYKSFFDGAGFFPFLIGCVLLGLGGTLTFIGVNSGGLSELKEVLKLKFIKSFIMNGDTIRVLLLLAMMMIYIFIFLGRIPFVIATSIYLFATFMYLKAYKKTWIFPGWVMSLVTAILTSVIVYYSFKIGLGLTLP